MDDKNSNFLEELLPWSETLPENIQKPEKADEQQHGCRSSLIFFKVLRFYRLHPKNDKKKTNEKGLTKLISVRPFCWFHTYYLINTRFRINNAKISRVIILLSNRTLSALKCPVYKGFQKIFLLELLCGQRFMTRKGCYQRFVFRMCVLFLCFSHRL